MASHPGGRFYAFLYHDESGEGPGPALLRLETLSAAWFDGVWNEMAPDSDVPFLAETLSEMEGRDFGAALDGLPRPGRQLLYALHRHFARRIWDDPAPVGILELMVDEETTRRTEAAEGEWFEVVLGPGEELADLRNPEEEGEAILAELAVPPEPDPRPTIHRLESFEPLRASAEVVPRSPLLLTALHFPQTLPDGEDEWPEEVQAATIAPDGVKLQVKLHRRCPPDAEPLTEEEHAQQREKFAACDKGFCWCLHDYATEQVPWRRRRRWASAARTVPFAVTVSAVTAVVESREGGVYGMQGTATAAAPPLSSGATVAATFQPLVGINAIGAGNNVTLWDLQGQPVAYVDYGFPVPTNLSTWPAGPDPCVCADPLMILTHWDYDHFAMVRRNAGAFGLRWVAPRQKMGSAALRELYQPLLLSGGQGGRLYLWCSPGGHLVTDFGVIERARGKHAPNEDGLVVYVRVDAGAALLAGLSRQPTRVRNSAIIPRGSAIPAEWIDGAVDPPFSGDEVVVPAIAGGDFAALNPEPAAGGTVDLPIGVRGRWIPAAGVPCAGGGTYVPSGNDGGWAISAGDYVLSGGTIFDFPGPETGHDGSILISGVPEDGESADGGGAEDERWRPAWGAGGREVRPDVGARLLEVDNAAISFDADAAYVLLPGDAGFQHIGGVANGTPAIVGLVASHHGSATWISRAASKKTGDIKSIPAPGGAGCEQVVFAYGTRLDPVKRGGHCYAYRGGEGHPHGSAIAAYQQRGWGVTQPGAAGDTFRRLDAAPEDYRSAQPFDPLTVEPTSPVWHDAARQGHRSGDVALGWDSVAGGPLQGDHAPAQHPSAPPPGPQARPPIRRVCPRCKQARDYYF